MNVSIVIPTFNEAGNVSELLNRLATALGPAGWEVVFVDDDSPDGTAAAVRSIAISDSRVRCVQRVHRRGLSSACIEGMLATSAPYIAVMDADLQHDERILPQMLAAAQNADVVVATRYSQGGGTGDFSASRLKLSRLATALGNAVVRHQSTDPMSGFFMISRKLLETTVHNLSGLGFKILLDILATAQQPLRVAEVPYTFRNRLHGDSKLDENVLWEYAMLLADKAIGRYIPVRFVAFTLIGSVGLFAHLAVLAALRRYTDWTFGVSEVFATLIAMVFNFALNNILTYRDRRLRGLSWFTGLMAFIAACGLGAIANVGIATALFENRIPWTWAAAAGVLVGAVWNYSVTSLYTWKK